MTIDERVSFADPTRKRPATPGAAVIAGQHAGEEPPDDRDAEKPAPRPVNLKFLILSSVVALVASAAVFGLHDYQMQRMASAYLTRCQQARAEGDSRAASRYLRRYLDLVPDDMSARVQLALTLHEMAETPRQYLNVYLRYETILRDDRDQQKVRRKLVDVAMLLGRHRDAALHIQILLHDRPGDGRLQRMLAECLETNGEYERAVAAYEAAIQAEPRRYENYESLARLLSERLGRPEEARQRLNRMVQANPNDTAALLARARFHVEHDQLRTAAFDARKAYRLSPDDSDVLALIADLIVSQSGQGNLLDDFDPLEIRRGLRRAAESRPDDLKLTRALAQLEIQTGRADLAERRLRAALDDEPGNADLLWALVDLLATEGKTAEARRELSQLERAGVPAEVAAYLEGRLAMFAGNWMTAARRFEFVQRSLNGQPRILANVNLHLAECYRRLGHNRRELMAHERAVEKNELSVTGRLGLASSLARSGELDKSLALFNQIRHYPGVDLAISRLLIEKNLRRPPEERNWDEVDRALDAAVRDDSTDRMRLRLLRAAALQAQSRVEDARRLLEQAVQREPDEASLQIALAELHYSQGAVEQAEGILSKARAQLGPQAALDVAWLRHWSRRPQQTAVQQVQAVLDNLDRRGGPAYADKDRIRVLASAAEAYRALQRPQAAMGLWKRLTAERPDAVWLWRRLAEAALWSRSGSELKQAVAELKRIEGKQGPYWKLYEAKRLLQAAEEGDRSGLVRASRLLSELRTELPTLPDVWLALAAMEEFGGDPDAAIEYYREALASGARDSRAVRRMVQLLYQRRRFLEAQRVLKEIRQDRLIEIDGELGRLTTAVALRNQQVDLALQAARDTVPADSENPREQLWMAGVLWSAGKPDEAENHFRRAVALGPSRPESWIGLVYYLARRGRDQEAEQAVSDAADALPEEQREVALAQCYQALGDPSRAEEHYRRALQQHPEDVALLFTAARFFTASGRPRESEQLLRRLTRLARKDASSRRLLARARRDLALINLAIHGYNGFREGLKLIEQNIEENGETAADLRVQATLLASRPMRRTRRRAIRILESLDRRFALRPSDQFALIRLYLAADQWEQARDSIHALLAAEGNNPDYLAFCLDKLIAHGEIGSVTEQYLKQLERQQPQVSRTIGLKFQFLVGQKRVEEALELCRARIEQANPEQVAETTRRFALLLDDVSGRLEHSGRTVAAEQVGLRAEKLYRRYVSMRPDEKWRLISFLGRQWRLQEALNLAEEAWNESPSERLGAACVEILGRGRPSAEDFRRVRGWLTRAAEQNPGSASHQLQLANLCNLAGDYEGAIKHYKATLEIAPQNLVAHNELALLLALREEDLQQALSLINRAVNQVAGPLPYLLDTRATVRLALGQSEQALRDLEEAVADGPSPARYFHLAQAHAALKNRAAADTAYRAAVAAGLRAESLHPLERAAYARLSSRMRGF